jgi:hypothetical protein
MKDTRGLLLREAWEQKGAPDCQHPELSREHSFSNSFTGCYICTTCGQLVQIKQLDEASFLSSKILFCPGNRYRTESDAVRRGQEDRQVLNVGEEYMGFREQWNRN